MANIETDLMHYSISTILCIKFSLNILSNTLQKSAKLTTGVVKMWPISQVLIFGRLIGASLFIGLRLLLPVR